MFFSRLYPASWRRFATSLGETFVCKFKKMLTASFIIFGGCGSLKVVKALLNILFFTSGFCGLLAFGESSLLAFGESNWLSGTSTFSRKPARLIEVWTHLVSVYNSCVAASVRFWISCAIWHAARYLGHHRRRWCTSRADQSSLLNGEKIFYQNKLKWRHSDKFQFQWKTSSYSNSILQRLQFQSFIAITCSNLTFKMNKVRKVL